MLCLMIQLHCHKWDYFSNLSRLISLSWHFPHASFSSLYRPLPFQRQFLNVVRNPLKRQADLLCICQLFQICKWLTCYPKFLRRRKNSSLDLINLIAGRWKCSNFLLAPKGSFSFLLPPFIWNYQYFFNKCCMSTTHHSIVRVGLQERCDVYIKERTNSWKSSITHQRERLRSFGLTKWLQYNSIS